MIMINRIKLSRGQTALEYLLLLSIVAGVVIVSLSKVLPKVHDASETQYNKIARVIMGEDAAKINGEWCPAICPNNGCVRAITKVCGCPAPAFGGDFCQGEPVISCTPDSSCANANCIPYKLADGITTRCSTTPSLPSCGQTLSGLDSCGGVCSKRGPSCGTCNSIPPEPVGVDCPGTRTNIPDLTPWTMVQAEAFCSSKCQKYCNPGETLNTATGTCSRI